MGIPLPLPQKGGGPPKFSAHVYCDQTAGAPSPILRVEVENFEIGPEVGALPVIAKFVAIEQQRVLVKTSSESV